MSDLIVRPFDGAYDLQVRRHDCPGEVEYVTLCRGLTEEQAREIVSSGRVYWLYGDPVTGTNPASKSPAALIDALRWFFKEDDTQDIPSNGYWVLGLERARKALAEYDGGVYEPLVWANQEPWVCAELKSLTGGSNAEDSD